MIGRKRIITAAGGLYNQQDVLRNDIRKEKLFYTPLNNLYAIEALIAKTGIETYK